MVDIEAQLFMLILKLKEDKNMIYSEEECDVHIAYRFNNYDEFKDYFVINGCPDINDDLLSICKMKRTRKGSIIALKKLCDYTITKSKNLYINDEKPKTFELKNTMIFK